MLESAFNALYDNDAISEDAFLEWECDTDPKEQLGKGICITSVRSFLTWLKEEEQGY